MNFTQSLITWNYGLADHTGFLLQRSTNSGSTWPVGLSFSSTASQYIDDNLSIGQTYWYRIAAINAQGTSSFSNITTVKVFGAPSGSINDLVATSGSAILSWSYSANDHNGFNIEKSTDGITYSVLTAISNSAVMSYSDSAVTTAVTYSYRANAYNVYGTGSYSNVATISFAVPPPPPAPPGPISPGSYKICGWAAASSSLTSSGGAAASTSPEWDGVFNYKTTSSLYSYDIWYFSGSSIASKAVAADETPSWPAVAWTDEVYTQIFWDTPNWILQIADTNGGYWWYGQSNTSDPTNPSGSYARVSGTGSLTPATMSVLSGSQNCLNLLTNGGFETGNFTGWTLTDPTPVSIAVVTGNSVWVHSGTYGVRIDGPFAAPGTLTGSIAQTITTGIGNSYDLSFWLNAPVNEFFQVYWENSLVADLSSSVHGWKQYYYQVTSTGATSELRFDVQNVTYYYALDDIFVVRR